MKRFDVFSGVGPVEGPKPLPPLEQDERRTDPALYVTGKPLRAAVNVAIALGRPLLVTGEAGTGKTQVAYRIAYELEPNGGKPLRFQMKARTEGSDLFYRYDALHHFQDVQMKREKPFEKYLRLEALGTAILRAEKDRDKAAKYIGEGEKEVPPRRSVVLIDEIDKAPRDLPNDILGEIEDMAFEIKETGETFRAEADYKPLVILTSNSERDLPDAFLRRCVYHHIHPPTAADLREIVSKRVKLDATFSPVLLESAIERYEELRGMALKKKPATDELIAWVEVLQSLQIDPKKPKEGQAEALAFSYSVLLKDPQDLVQIRGK